MFFVSYFRPLASILACTVIVVEEFMYYEIIAINRTKLDLCERWWWWGKKREEDENTRIRSKFCAHAHALFLRLCTLLCVESRNYYFIIYFSLLVFVYRMKSEWNQRKMNYWIQYVLRFFSTLFIFSIGFRSKKPPRQCVCEKMGRARCAQVYYCCWCSQCSHVTRSIWIFYVSFPSVGRSWRDSFSSSSFFNLKS